MLARGRGAARAQDAYLFRRGRTCRPSTSSACATVGPYADEAALSALCRTRRRGHLRVRERAGRARSKSRVERGAGPSPRPSPSPSRRTVSSRRISCAGSAFPSPPYADVHDEQRPARCAVAQCKPPAILKTRRFGYDGKGQALIRNEDEAPAALAGDRRRSPPLLEGLVPFEREISVIVVRGQDGALKFYDPVENVHQNGILAISRVPARIAARLRRRGASRSPARSPRRSAMSACSAWRCSSAKARARACSSTRSRRACTIPAIGPSMPASSASSRTMSGPLPAGRSATRHATAMR